jgi:hypothetical protein
MRRLQSVLPGLRHTKPPQRTFLAPLCGRLLRLPGPATLRKLSRYSLYDARPVARGSAREVDFVSLHTAAIPRGMPPAQEQALVLEARVVPKSGTQPSGLARCWNGSDGRSEQGLELSALAWLAITANCAYALSVEQTPSVRQATAPAATRREVSLEQLTRVVSAHDLSHLSDVSTDGDASKQQVLRGVRALGRHQIGTLRSAANLRALYHGAKRPGPGRPKTYDGKVHWEDLRRFAQRETDDPPRGLSHQVLHQVQCQGNLHVGRVVATQPTRRAGLFRPDVDVAALTLDRYDTARVHRAFLCRDAPQCPGVCDCQARSHATLDFHCNASLTAVTLATLEARQHNGGAGAAFSMASLTRRACNQPLIDRIGAQFAKGHSLAKSSPASEDLCHYGSMTA